MEIAAAAGDDVLRVRVGRAGAIPENACLGGAAGGAHGKGNRNGGK